MTGQTADDKHGLEDVKIEDEETCLSVHLSAPHIMMDAAGIQLRGVVVEVKRHEDREKMEEEIRHALARAREEQSRLEETAQQRFAAAMRHYAEKEKELKEMEMEMETDSKAQDGKQEEEAETETEKEGEQKEKDEKEEKDEKKEREEKDEREAKVKAIRQEMEKAAAAARKAVRDRMDFERTEGLEDENEYILRRVLDGKGTAYEICSEEDMQRMLVLAMEHHMATRGVDYAAVRRREKEGQLTDADRAVIQWAEDNARKAHWPRNALYAARKIDAERDAERGAEKGTERGTRREKEEGERDERKEREEEGKGE